MLNGTTNESVLDNTVVEPTLNQLYVFTAPAVTFNVYELPTQRVSPIGCTDMAGQVDLMMLAVDEVNTFVHGALLYTFAV